MFFFHLLVTKPFYKSEVLDVTTNDLRIHKTISALPGTNISKSFGQITHKYFGNNVGLRKMLYQQYSFLKLAPLVGG